MGVQDKINEIKAEIARTQKNKKTEFHIGILKAKLAKHTAKLNEPKATSQKMDSFEVAKAGDARVALIGFPSVGKSTLLGKITTTFSKAAEHEFTTLDCISGKMYYGGACIQVLDLPGIISGAAENKGRGKQVIAMAKTADLIVMVLDPRKTEDKRVLEKELYDAGIRLNRKKPDVSITYNVSGINIGVRCNLTKTTENTIRAILKEYKINNCQMFVKEDVSADDIIDMINKSAVYVDCLYVYNKIDELSYDDFLSFANLENTAVVSCRKDWNIDDLQEHIWEKLCLTRVYTKKKGLFPELNDPVVIRRNGTIKTFCSAIHKDFESNFRYALVWGISAKHNPQKVGLSHELKDEDVVQIFLK